MLSTGKSFQTSTAITKAFTLVELLATTTLMAIVLPVVMAGISMSLSTAGLAKQQAQAAAFAHSKLMELVAAEEWQQTELTGDFAPEQPDYQWAALVSEWDGTEMRELDVTVSWRAKGKDYDVTMSTLVYVTEDGL